MLILFSILGGCTLVFMILIMAAPEVDITTNQIVHRRPSNPHGLHDRPTALLTGS